MFTGIIEEQGILQSIQWGSQSAVLSIKATKVLENVSIGDSICTNGCCLTVTAFTSHSFSVDVMAETMRSTTLSELKRGANLNLERALQLSDRLGGHILSGHIDGLGTIKSISREDNAVWFSIEAPQNILKYIIKKGSIALDGISLTVADVSTSGFKVSIIPQTAQETNLLSRQLGDQVNLETDMIGKYIERFMGFQSEETKKDSVDMKLLRDNGFI